MLDYEMIETKENYEEIQFCNFMSDYDSSLVLLLTYCPRLKCSYLKLLKIFNEKEQEETKNFYESTDLEETTYSMVEDEAKRKLIRNIRDNLENEPSVKRENLPGFQSDNLQIKL